MAADLAIQKHLGGAFGIFPRVKFAGSSLVINFLQVVPVFEGQSKHLLLRISLDLAQFRQTSLNQIQIQSNYIKKLHLFEGEIIRGQAVAVLDQLHLHALKETVLGFPKKNLLRVDLLLVKESLEFHQVEGSLMPHFD